MFIHNLDEIVGIPIQVSSDRGSEIRNAYSFQHALRYGHGFVELKTCVDSDFV